MKRKKRQRKNEHSNNKKLEFREYYDRYSNPELGSIYNLVVIMRFLEQEGWDFTKKEEDMLPPQLRGKPIPSKYLVRDENGEEYYL